MNYIEEMIEKRRFLKLLITQAENVGIRQIQQPIYLYETSLFLDDNFEPIPYKCYTLQTLIDGLIVELRKKNREYKIFKGKRRSASMWGWVYVDFKWEGACVLLKATVQRDLNRDLSLILNRKPLVWTEEGEVNSNYEIAFSYIRFN